MICIIHLQQYATEKLVRLSLLLIKNLSYITMRHFTKKTNIKHKKLG